MSSKTVTPAAPGFLVQKIVREGDAPVWTSLDADETPREEVYDGPERRSGVERRVANMAHAKFGKVDRRVVIPFGRRKSDRAGKP